MFDVVISFIELGFKHIVPLGLDHILFVLGLFLASPNIKPLLIQATFFTIAHTISLVMVANKLMLPNPNIIEPLISISIVFIAIENIFITQINSRRYWVIFLFGLIHGMGFASAFIETSINNTYFYTSLFSFNVGVEIGQILILLLAYFIVGKPYGSELWYRKQIVIPVSMLIAIIAIGWTYKRICL
jgi:hypothetical protein